MIDIKNDSYLFKQGFIDNNLLALKIDGIQEYAILFDENKINANLSVVIIWKNLYKTIT